MRGPFFAAALAACLAQADAFLQTVLTTAGSVIVSLIAGESVKKASNEFAVDAARLVSEALTKCAAGLGAAGTQLGKDLITALGNAKVGLDAPTLRMLDQFVQTLNGLGRATSQGADVLAANIAAVSTAWQQVAMSSQARFYSFASDSMTWATVLLVAGTVACALYQLRAREATSIATSIRLIALPTTAVSAAAVLLTAALQSAGASHVISLFSALVITFAGWWLVDWAAADVVTPVSTSNAKTTASRAHAAPWALGGTAIVVALAAFSVGMYAALLSTSIAAMPRGSSTTAFSSAQVGDFKYSFLPPEKMDQMEPGWLHLDGRKLDVNCPRQRLLADVLNSVYLPDTRGRMIVGAGTGAGLTPRKAFDTGGAESVQLAEKHLPSHRHDGITAENWGRSFKGDNNGPKTAHSVRGAKTAPAGGDEPHENMPPWTALYAYVKA